MLTTMAANYSFTEDDMAVDEGLGYPKAYAIICRDRGFGPYHHGPPFTFTPYSLHQNESLRAKELDKLFPILDPKAKSTTKTKMFIDLSWKQLNHLGNAGFDPEVIRVDPYGNVLYYRADTASPLAWDIDHWFPCSRGGLTVPSNLRIVQKQVCKKKKNKLEFLVPWWDLQLGISVNHFLSFFAASNSDFRNRAFSFLFEEGETEEVNASQTVESYCFPQHYIESIAKSGFAPAAIVVSREPPSDPSLVLRSLDYNRQQSPAIARKVKPGSLKENENPNVVTNPYNAIVMARDSLKQRDEIQKLRVEVKKLDEEVDESMRKNEEEKLSIQELEMELLKRKRRVEKCRRLSEAQSSYRTMLEKMIRDAMHQNVIYKEQIRLNQAATNALMARLEAQKAMCDASEKELHIRFKQREELEKQIMPEWEQVRKRSRMDDSLFEEKDSKTVLYLPSSRLPNTPLHKELRKFLEEEQKLSETDAASYLNTYQNNKEMDRKSIEGRLQTFEIGEGSSKSIRFPNPHKEESEEDEDCKRQRGKGNIEKWLHMLLENHTEQEFDDFKDKNETNKKGDIIKKQDLKYPKNQRHNAATQLKTEKGENIEEQNENGPEEVGTRNNFENNAKEKKLARSESRRVFRRIPSSPPLISGMKKGVDCIAKKPTVTSDGEDDNIAAGNNFIKSSIKTIKKAVKF